MTDNETCSKSFPLKSRVVSRYNFDRAVGTLPPSSTYDSVRDLNNKHTNANTLAISVYADDPTTTTTTTTTRNDGQMSIGGHGRRGKGLLSQSFKSLLQIG